MIDTVKVSLTLRDKAINQDEQSVLITNFANSLQEKDLTEPHNCHGFGRVRHFRLQTDTGWNINPLPILPCIKALSLEATDMIRAQVFQNAVCNWRCWYCFVDFKLLSGNRQFSDYLTCETLLDYYQEQESPPVMIDLTGGQPDLTPEWIPWMMDALIRRGLDKKIYLWSDDNLSNDYFWRYLSKEQIERVRSYTNYGRVCCFKGIDELSFHHNTNAEPSGFELQFELVEKLLGLGIDLYSYITLPALPETNFKDAIASFCDKIQAIDPNYLLRIVPLKIFEFSPVVARVKDLQTRLLEGQAIAINYWNDEISKRFSIAELALPITDVVLKNRQT
ncbi:MAG: radical SAM protein [Bacteroidetes bacterium]|nr:radical SAM protein [Bacteroidota bacterium]